MRDVINQVRKAVDTLSDSSARRSKDRRRLFHLGSRRLLSLATKRPDRVAIYRFAHFATRHSQIKLQPKRLTSMLRLIDRSPPARLRETHAVSATYASNLDSYAIENGPTVISFVRLSLLSFPEIPATYRSRRPALARLLHSSRQHSGYLAARVEAFGPLSQCARLFLSSKPMGYSRL